MKVVIKRKTGEIITYDKAYEVYSRGSEDKHCIVVYPDELEGVETEMIYRTETIESITLTFNSEAAEACEKCAYNDEGSCSCFEPASIGCPYAEEGD